ncbi:MAG: mercuric transporter MerT family protein [Vicinamibacterales bacterium]
MKLALAAIGGAIGASACCIGPVVFSLIGAGALSAASVRLEPYRPWFIAFTVVLVATAFYGAYRPVRDDACTGPGGGTGFVNIWVSTRQHKDDRFGEPMSLDGLNVRSFNSSRASPRSVRSSGWQFAQRVSETSISTTRLGPSDARLAAERTNTRRGGLT